MSGELVGIGSAVAGSEQYFRGLNEACGMAPFMEKPEGFSYKAGLTALAKKTVGVLEEVYNDLCSGARALRYVPGTERRRLEGFVLGLCAVSLLGSGGGGKKDKCVNLLILRDNSTKAYSKASDKEIQEGVKRAEKSRYLTAATRTATLLKASIYGGARAAAGSKEKGLFLMEVMGRFGEDFLKDVCLSIGVEKGRSPQTGKCGKKIFGKEYREHYEKRLFFQAGFGGVLGDYEKALKGILQKTAATLVSLTAKSALNGDHITYKNRTQLGACAAELRKIPVAVAKSFEKDLEKFRRLEDFNNEVIVVDRAGFTTPVEAALLWKNGKNELNINAKVGFDVLTVSNKQKQDAIRGFKEWAGHYTVFGGQSVDVTVDVKEGSFEFGLTVAVLWPGFRPISFGGGSETGLWGWGVETFAPKVMLLGPDANSPDFINVAKHEFGHALGIGDLYADAGLGLPGVKPGTYSDLPQTYIDQNGKDRYDVVMDNNGPVTDNDIEMVIRAFQTGKRQEFQTQNFWASHITEVSDVLGK